ncbi:STM4013/SEN3800 family hydrolase [Variovorax sp. RKNM96]|uniref:STM4013/SEN3800 family hydrolase n=1 Tax=Variovorax sp. RKNM96 TaxID=2681552 RepID=UPI00197EF363|nr:STM4013/SEN3800 family hydrolase [Variovorax sp. RKNM96]
MNEPVDMNRVVGTHDIVLITLDTLRYDVAQTAFERGELPVLSRHLPAQGWEKRHTPGNFTYAAHHAFFAGYLPTPARPGAHPRLFATAFRGSETTARTTFVFDEENIPKGLGARGYRTVCIGGVGFFNKQNALGQVFPGMFAESHWHPTLGVGHRRSTERQVDLAMQRLHADAQRVFLFINVSSIHTPNRAYLPGHTEDSIETHAAALRYVDGALGPLFDACASRGPTFVIVCSDHGTAYGDDGYHGHRIGHDCVWTVPYAHFFLGAPC